MIIISFLWWGRLRSSLLQTLKFITVLALNLKKGRGYSIICCAFSLGSKPSPIPWRTWAFIHTHLMFRMKKQIRSWGSCQAESKVQSVLPGDKKWEGQWPNRQIPWRDRAPGSRCPDPAWLSTGPTVLPKKGKAFAATCCSLACAWLCDTAKSFNFSKPSPASLKRSVFFLRKD